VPFRGDTNDPGSRAANVARARVHLRSMRVRNHEGDRNANGGHSQSIVVKRRAILAMRLRRADPIQHPPHFKLPLQLLNPWPHGNPADVDWFCPFSFLHWQ
jgi:hypothetical protein